MIIRFLLALSIMCLVHPLPVAPPLHTFVQVAEAGPAPEGYGPVQLHTAYNLPCTPGGPAQAICPQPAQFGGQTIGIVDWWNTAALEQDLEVYDREFGLPDCTRQNGCLRIVNQRGKATLPLREADGEIPLDVEIAHATCQTCKILLVEADNPSPADVAVAENTAARLGANEISNSFGGYEGGDPKIAAAFNHPGVAIVASSGDDGWGASEPAGFPSVIAVGGTVLTLNPDNTRKSEVAWSDAGSGCSAFWKAPPWQKRMPHYSDVGCFGTKSIADVAADASLQSGVAMFWSHWYTAGGTSVGSPLIAAAIALAGGLNIKHPATYLYAHRHQFWDVDHGRNGQCTYARACNAMPGYDGPTGIGSPNGLGGL